MKKKFPVTFIGQKDESEQFLCYGCPLFSIRYDKYEEETLDCGIVGIVINDYSRRSEDCPFNKYETITIKRLSK